MSFTDVPDMILRILERQRNAILRGRILEMQQDTILLERLLARLAASQPQLRIMTKIQTAAHRNATLLLAAKQGIEDATRLLGQGQAQEFSTYTMQGRRQSYAASAPTQSWRG
jgi:hypothetical protein